MFSKRLLQGLAIANLAFASYACGSGNGAALQGGATSTVGSAAPVSAIPSVPEVGTAASPNSVVNDANALAGNPNMPAVVQQAATTYHSSEVQAAMASASAGQATNNNAACSTALTNLAQAGEKLDNDIENDNDAAAAADAPAALAALQAFFQTCF